MCMLLILYNRVTTSLLSIPVCCQHAIIVTSSLPARSQFATSLLLARYHLYQFAASMLPACYPLATSSIPVCYRSLLPACYQLATCSIPLCYQQEWAWSEEKWSADHFWPKKMIRDLRSESFFQSAISDPNIFSMIRTYSDQFISHVLKSKNWFESIFRWILVNRSFESTFLLKNYPQNDP